MIILESKKKSLDSLSLDYPDATILDVTNQADGGWVKLSPQYPHGGIPVPFSPGYTAESVEGIWQGLKVFEKEGVSQTVMHKMGMSGLKRAGKKLGAYLGHQKGIESQELLNELEARKQIFIPTFDWVLENRCKSLIEKLRIYSESRVVVLLDNDTNSNVENLKKPLSPAALLVRFIVSRLTDAEREEWKVQAEENDRLSKCRKAQYKIEQKKAGEKAAMKAEKVRQDHDKAMVKGNSSDYTPLWVQNQLQAGVKLRFLSFLRPNAPLGKIDRACLSPWYSCRFEIDGIKYCSLEQYIKAEKARIFEDEDSRSIIMSKHDPEAIKKLGREVRNFDEKKWTEVRFDLAVSGNLAKFSQNESLKDYLLSTEDRILVETHPYDNIWGVGLPDGHKAIRQPEIWPGSNLMGFALMVVRDRIKASLEEKTEEKFTFEGTSTSKNAGEGFAKEPTSEKIDVKPANVKKTMTKIFKEKPLPVGLSFQEQRAIRKKIFAETVEIVECGAYETKTGVVVELPNDKAMREGSVLYQKELPAAGDADFDGKTSVKVLEQDCIVAAKGLLDRGYNPAVLNLASSWSPGGGVVQGSRAQEESIFRRTNLYRSLYQFAHGGKPDMFTTKPEPIDLKKTPHYKEHLDYHFGGIYTPGATVFRATNGELFQKPFAMSFITVAAIKEPVLTPTGHLSDADKDQTRDKIRTILRIGLKHGHDCLVLGALGCGAYGNPPADVARLFHEVIEEDEFCDKYRMIVFAIIGQKCYVPFKNELDH